MAVGLSEGAPQTVQHLKHGAGTAQAWPRLALAAKGHGDNVMDHFYPIGTPGKPWTDNEKARWFEAQRIQRSYRQEVLDRLQHLDDRFTLEPYGALTIDPTRYPLMVARPSKPIANAPWALVTGGVHGYETSGVKGATTPRASTC